MNKPYIICHMMTSVDGRIDCGMTAQLQGNEEYYATLNAIETLTTVSGRVTAELEMAQPGKFQPKNGQVIGKTDFAKNATAQGYEVIVDTKGVLLWNDDANANKPHLIIMSEQANREYLQYLDSKHISWIAVGEQHVDLTKASEILADEFGVERMAIVGGGHINGAFLDSGLTDEISLLIGLGIDGREGMPAVFDGRPQGSKPIALKLKSVQSYDDGAVWLRYDVKN